MKDKRHLNRIVAGVGALVLLASFVTEMAVLLIVGLVLLLIGLANDERWSGGREW